MNRSTVDVRPITPRERHPIIFNTFDALAPGETFELVNDHDPKPLQVGPTAGLVAPLLEGVIP